MQNQIFRLREQGGFILYERDRSRDKGYAPIPKYFIVGKEYFEEFRLKSQAKKAFLKLIA